MRTLPWRASRLPDNTVRRPCHCLRQGSRGDPYHTLIGQPNAVVKLGAAVRRWIRLSAADAVHRTACHARQL